VSKSQPDEARILGFWKNLLAGFCWSAASHLAAGKYRLRVPNAAGDTAFEPMLALTLLTNYGKGSYCD
jgi:hypothetical protein